MIASYRDKLTRDFAVGKRVKAFSAIERAARLKLDRVEAAVTLKDLAVLPVNHLEALKGNRKGLHSIRINDRWRIFELGGALGSERMVHSIRINDRWRICFEWTEEEAGSSNVQIVDYH